MSEAWGKQLDAAVALHQRGELDAAELGYRTLAAQAPDNPHPTHYLGLIALQRGDAERAVALIEGAIKLAPGVAEFHVNLGNALKRLGRLAEAADAYRHALAIRTDFFEARFNLGLALELAGNHVDAVAALLSAHDLRPDASLVLTSLARLFLAMGRTAEALSCSERSVALPRPVLDSVLAHANLLIRLGTPHKAVRLLRKSAETWAGSAPFQVACARALDATGDYAPAESAFRRALAIAPADVQAWGGLAVTLKNQGRVADALAAYQRAIDHAPDDPGLRSSYLFTLLMADGVSEAELVEAHRDYGKLFGASIPVAAKRPHGRATGVLRVGYLSADLRQHPVGYFLRGILRGHDATRVEVLCYHTGVIEDALSADLRGKAQRWIHCAHLTDAALAEKIRADGVDVLVELSGHTAGNRLLALARRPAPVQVSYLGYAHATCLPWIDFRISDARADPPGVAEPEGCESVVRLPGTYFCYSPPDDAPDCGEAPVVKHGRMTFGAFLQLGKLSEATRDWWSAVLHAVPDARLLIRAKGLDDRGTREAVAESFVVRGVARDRLLLEGWQSHRDHLRAYRRVDCMLDTLPFNLATNTCEALWMGVPTVTIAGDRHGARMGASLLGAVGLDAFIAANPQDAVAIASRVASQPDQLSGLRRELRARVANSVLVDGARCAANLEVLYRQMYEAVSKR